MRQSWRRVAIGLAGLLASPAFAASIVVDTATDDFGGNLGNCSLREAVQTANADADFGGCSHTGVFAGAVTDVILLPTLGGGAFTLTRTSSPRDDTNVAGDLDVTGPLRIEGVSVANSVIRGDDTDPDADRDRVFHVLAGSLQLRDLTVRDGYVGSQAAGGGLRSEPGTTVSLLRVIVGLNRADGNGGGILNRGTMTLTEVEITGNQSEAGTLGGGGVFTSPGTTLTLIDSRIELNRVDAGSGGAGLYADAGATVTLQRVVVTGNQIGAGFGGGEGAGIHTRGETEILDSSVCGNDAGTGGNRLGGGIYANSAGCADALTVERSLICDNVAGDGGGVYGVCSASLFDSVVAGNRAAGGSGGGALLQRGRLIGTTVIGNHSDGDGGGLTLFESLLINTSVLDNTADDDGGGIAFDSLLPDAAARLAFVTVAGNESNADGLAGGAGGGVFLIAGEPPAVGHSVFAGNLENGLGGQDDCAAVVQSLGFNLIQDGDGCTLQGGSGDRVDGVAGLAAASTVGTPVVGAPGATRAMTVRAPAVGSVLIDGGSEVPCATGDISPPGDDQLGRARPADGPDADLVAQCDIGAIEIPALGDDLFGDGFEVPDA